MFYYPTALTRHAGCFATIWLAATKGSKLSRRDYLQVNVKKTSDDLMDYVLVRVAPPQPGLPRPRFSLYLSSQLQYGVIVVYHRQCGLLLDEIQATLNRLTKYTSENINLDDRDGGALCVPDALLLLTEAEGAPDPLFGVMTFGVGMPSPRTLIEMHDRFVGMALHEWTPPSNGYQSGITVSPKSITLKEREPVAILNTEFDGLELADHPDTIEFLLGQEENFFEEGREEVKEDDMVRELERAEEEAERDRAKEITGSTIALQPSRVSEGDGTLLPQEETSPPAERPPPPTGEVTPVSTPLMPPLPGEEQPETRAVSPQSVVLEEVPEGQPQPKRGGKKRKRRQLIFADQDTQLSQEELQQCIDDPMTETKWPLLPPAPLHRRLSAAHLLTEPCSGRVVDPDVSPKWLRSVLREALKEAAAASYIMWLHHHSQDCDLPEALRSLWKQAMTITPLSGSDLQVGERGTTSASGTEEELQENQSVEIFREMSDFPPALSNMSGQSMHSLESSDKEPSREISPQVTPEGKGAPGSVLEDIPEEVDLEIADLSLSVALAGPPEVPDTEETLLLFHTLVPPLADRLTVSTCFWRLLETVASRKLSVEQDKPYGDIRIFPGPNYEEGLSSENLFS